ncbi:sugar transferase [bacterium]|nr:sugar transferase [bacterium]MBU4510222.1 sugar transferase [bacterium]
MLKRLFDIIVCFISLPFLLPFFIIFAIIIKLSSPGPVFYRGLRTGLHGRTFRIFKFRTMVINAEKIGGGTTALNDFRIFKFGKFLRRYKLDELPQIINVIKGDMSIVGPRPELPQYTNQFKGEEILILSVRPGMTDYSSVKYFSLQEIVGSKNADQVFEENILKEKNKLRIKYVKEQNFFQDIKLIFQSFICIFRRIFNDK